MALYSSSFYISSKFLFFRSDSLLAYAYIFYMYLKKKQCVYCSKKKNTTGEGK